MATLRERTAKRESSKRKLVAGAGLRAKFVGKDRDGQIRTIEIGGPGRDSHPSRDKAIAAIAKPSKADLARLLRIRMQANRGTRIEKVEEVEVPVRLKPLMRRLGEALDRLPAH